MQVMQVISVMQYIRCCQPTRISKQTLKLKSTRYQYPKTFTERTVRMIQPMILPYIWIMGYRADAFKVSSH